MNDTLRGKIELLPELPGVYKMLDASGAVIYVGKAKNLKNRVKQYFGSKHNMSAKVAAMVRHIEDFEYIIVNSETEALALESNLIKTLMPHYNILLKDDKNYPYLRVDLRQDFPRFEVVRRYKNDGARYFGPYMNALAMKESLTAIREHFPIRHCKKDIKKAIDRRERPCLMHHIGRCCAPCTGLVTRESYHEYVNSIIKMLSGNTAELEKRLSEAMMQAAERMEFETAAELRDRLRAIQLIGEKQRAILTADREMDVFALCRMEGASLVFMLNIREGKVIGTDKFTMTDGGESDEEITASFLKQHYTLENLPARYVILRSAAEETEAIAEYLSELSGRRIRIEVPKRGEKLAFADMAYKNGMDELKKRKELLHREWERTDGALTELCGVIGMDELPARIECYDNSHIQGRDMVGGMVVFEDGKPSRSEYRRFRIKGQEGGDDYAAMREMLTRRFLRAADGDAKFAALPDLIVVDGGRGQLNVALEVLSEQGLGHINAIGLAERKEEIILPYSEESVILPQNSPALHILQRLRDEAHRFAISYHRGLRQKNALFSVLSGIDGVGEKRKRLLFDNFTTLEAIKNASVEELAAIKGMNRPCAEAIRAYFDKRSE